MGRGSTAMAQHRAHSHQGRDPHLVVGVELLVLPLALAEGLPLSLQRLRQVGVLQTLLGILLRKHLQLPLHRLQLLPAEHTWG